MEKDTEIQKRFEKIEDMLRHIHEHVENIDSNTWVIREGLQLVSQTTGDAVEYLQRGQGVNENEAKFNADIYRCMEMLTEGVQDCYTPIDEQDEARYDAEEKEREKIREDKSNKCCKSCC